MDACARGSAATMERYWAAGLDSRSKRDQVHLIMVVSCAAYGIGVAGERIHFVSNASGIAEIKSAFVKYDCYNNNRLFVGIYSNPILRSNRLANIAAYMIFERDPGSYCAKRALKLSERVAWDQFAVH